MFDSKVYKKRLGQAKSRFEAFDFSFADDDDENVKLRDLLKGGTAQDLRSMVRYLDRLSMRSEMGSKVKSDMMMVLMAMIRKNPSLVVQTLMNMARSYKAIK